MLTKVPTMNGCCLDLHGKLCGIAANPSGCTGTTRPPVSGLGQAADRGRRVPCMSVDHLSSRAFSQRSFESKIRSCRTAASHGSVVAVSLPSSFIQKEQNRSRTSLSASCTLFRLLAASWGLASEGSSASGRPTYAWRK